MDKNLIIRQSSKSDIFTITKLLKDNGLPTIDIGRSQIQLFIGEFNNQIVGVIGIEKYDAVGLLRSLAVDSNFTRLRIGGKLINQLFKFSKLSNITDVYLLTETAQKYFEKFRFETVERTNVPGVIMNTTEFKDICPQSAIVMHKKLIQ